jgi:hypothetical protein
MGLDSGQEPGAGLGAGLDSGHRLEVGLAVASGTCALPGRMRGGAKSGSIPPPGVVPVEGRSACSAGGLIGDPSGAAGLTGASR